MKTRLALLWLLIPSLVSAGEPDDSYSWPCNGEQYGNASLIYEAQFPGAHPGLTTIEHIVLTADLVTLHNSWSEEMAHWVQSVLPVKRKRRATSEVEVFMVNRRGNRPEGFRQQLIHSVNDSQTSFLSVPTNVELVEGDMVKIATRCTPIGKVPKRTTYLRYTLDFTGQEESNQ